MHCSRHNLHYDGSLEDCPECVEEQVFNEASTYTTCESCLEVIDVEDVHHIEHMGTGVSLCETCKHGLELKA